MDADAAIEEHRNELKDARNDELAVAAENYAWEVKKWFEEELSMHAFNDSGPSARETGDEDGSIDDAARSFTGTSFKLPLRRSGR